MDQELKEKWVAALRSGKYQQGTGAMCKKGTFCCLGVLAEVLGAQQVSWPDDYIIYEYGGTTHAAYFMGIVAEELGIQYHQNKLMDMNDQGSTFLEIADWIKENL